MKSLLLLCIMTLAPALDQEAEGRWAWVKVTGYTPWDAIDSRSGYQDGYTSTMVNTRSTDPNAIYGIAADPRVVPYGTQIYVPGYWESLQNNTRSRPTRMSRVDDTGGKVRRFRPHYQMVGDRRVWVEMHLDVRYRTRRGINRFLPHGVHYLQVFIYKE
jgi:3D (Asp-Asp-Asp) domain-containing protein